MTMMGRAVLVIATLALLTGGSWAQKQCGGAHNCNGHSACGDVAWADVECPPPSECVRKNADIWQCVAPAGAAKAAAGGAAPAAGAAAAGAPREYPVLTSGRRNESAPATKACACVDVGLNDGACFLGVTAYCEGAPGEPKPNVTLCEAMSGFFNFQNVTAAKIAAEFFVRTCALAVPENPSACGCLEGPNTESCRAMTIHACLLGNSMCPALAFGPEADQAAQEAQARYMNQNCGGALAAAQVGLNFTDMTKETFLRKYSQGVAAALAVISGQTLPSVVLLPLTQIKVGSLAGAIAPTGRKLAQANLKTSEKVLATYQIRSSAAEAPAVLSRLKLAAENGGEGLYKALAANGVPLRPSYSIENGPPLVGAVARRAPLRYAREPLEAGEIAGIVIGSVAGAALLAAAVWFGVKYCRRSRAPKAAGGGGGTAAASGKGAAQAAGAGAAPDAAAAGDKNGDRVVEVAAAAEAGAAKAAGAAVRQH